MRTILLFGISYFTLIFFARSQNFGNSGYCQGDNNINVSPWNSAVGNMKDALFMERANLNIDHTAIRLNIGDYGGALKDKLDIGYYSYKTGNPWVSGINLFSSGNIGIGTTVKGNIVIEDGVGPTEKYSLRIGMLQPPVSSGHQDGKLLCAGKGVFHSLIVYDPATWITWPDFVFNKKYNLLSLAETEKFIETEKHLPGVPTEKEVNEKGFDVLEMNKILLQKIEEMTLHLIRLEKEVEALKIKK